MSTTWGTSYFDSLEAACRYYGCTKKEVEQKIKVSEISIGSPPAKPGESMWLHPREKRYYITVEENMEPNFLYDTKTTHVICVVPPGKWYDDMRGKMAENGEGEYIIATSAEIQPFHDAFWTTEPEEIDREKFDEMLNVLPPRRWCCEGGQESFQMCEFTSGLITSIYVRIGTGAARYFTFDDSANMRHTEAVRKVLNSEAYKKGEGGK